MILEVRAEAREPLKNLKAQLEPPRIAVVGTSGSGKTTVARQLANLYGVPHVELDAYMHQPNWTPSAPEVFRERVAEVLADPSWVTDGNYHQVRDIVWGQATTIVWLDLPLRVSLRRLIPRTFSRMMRGTELWNGNKEELRNFLDWNNVILWAIKTHFRRRREYVLLTALNEFAHLKIVRLRTPRQIRHWLASVQEDQSRILGVR